MIDLYEHDPQWAPRFRTERDSLLMAFPGCFLGIEHIGSTAIPGLRAKPIIDMLGIVGHLEACVPVAAKIDGLGYMVRGENGIAGRRYFTREAPDAIHFHVYAEGDPRIGAHLRFRDHLRANPSSRREYEALKLRLADLHADDRAAYTAAKSSFCAEIDALTLARRSKEG